MWTRTPKPQKPERNHKMTPGGVNRESELCYCTCHSGNLPDGDKVHECDCEVCPKCREHIKKDCFDAHRAHHAAGVMHSRR